MKNKYKILISIIFSNLIVFATCIISIIIIIFNKNTNYESFYYNFLIFIEIIAAFSFIFFIAVGITILVNKPLKEIVTYSIDQKKYIETHEFKRIFNGNRKNENK